MEEAPRLIALFAVATFALGTFVVTRRSARDAV
jgi:hypothetical protein